METLTCVADCANIAGTLTVTSTIDCQRVDCRAEPYLRRPRRNGSWKIDDKVSVSAHGPFVGVNELTFS